MTVEVPRFEHTPVESIPEIVSRVRTTFHTHKTRDVQYRLVQLRKLYWGMKDNEQALVEACKLDLGKQSYETYLTEVGWVENDIIFTCNHLVKWAQDEKAQDIDFNNSFVSPKIRSDPLGCVLVIGAYNFPIQLSMGPFIGAMAAGCTAILKPSEGAPHSAAVMQRIIETSLDPSSYAVVQGAIPETTALLAEKWDKIFYTGGYVVGRIIAKKAAETLTPVALELGGLNPAIVTKNADVKLAAKRLLWGKIFNAGQVCLSQNYTLVDKEILEEFIIQMKAAMKEFFPNGAKASPDYGRIASDRHFLRMKAMVDNSNGKIIMGGGMDGKARFIEPTVVVVNDVNDSLLKEESFGPLIPILAVDNLDQAISIANSIQSTPLALYPFGNKKETAKILTEIRSGGASINEFVSPSARGFLHNVRPSLITPSPFLSSYFHGCIPTLPFGGVGESGTGAYRGKASFDCFTHKRSITSTPSWIEFLLSVRYPPYTGKLEKMQKMTMMKANFDREGRMKFNLLTWVLTLGGSDTKTALGRWTAAIVAAVGAKIALDRRSKL